ncbi:MAG: hypothetical protein U5J82_02320 [Desulfobacterales bacterium]|nr:hypothetical protein [Desulfobacterales bacterium]
MTGVSGSGKSTLVLETLTRLLAQQALPRPRCRPAATTGDRRASSISTRWSTSTSPPSARPRAPTRAPTPGVFTFIRELFARTPEARMRGYKPGRFSFNVKGGRCEACGGDGIVKIEMHFLPDVYVTCDVCRGRRYNRETLEIRYKGKNIAEVLEMTVDQAHRPFLTSIAKHPRPSCKPWSRSGWAISSSASRPPPFPAGKPSG